MDATEDKEVKLQRASGDLVKEFQAKLPSLLWKPETNHGKTLPRRWTLVSRTERLVSLLEPFQEWPQLLDPHLQQLLPPLVDAFLAYLLKHRDQYTSNIVRSQQSLALYPLPRAVCRLLYTFCKVRGVKVISRFLNNEPKYLDPLLRAFIEWDSTHADDSGHASSGDIPRRLVWEERYVLLIWLSHLLLAPFDLSSMSSDDIPAPYDAISSLKLLPSQAPTVTKSLLSVALEYVNAAGKEREAATVLLARLALRRDMQSLGILTRLTDWAFTIIHPPSGTEPSPVYAYIGVLSFLARLGASGQTEEFSPLIVPIFEQIIRISSGTSSVSQVIQSSALARKTIIKILRSVTVLALSLSGKRGSTLSNDEVSSILEDAIDHFLVALADKDTPVRFAASKALSIITLKLDTEMATDVIEAVTGSLEENILYEKNDGTIITPSEARGLGTNILKRNLSAVDAQRWQGLILTLGHLLFRRAPPIYQLPDIVQPLVSGLCFEQRSSTGSSVGTGVRDAACFGIWALSRKYTTQELLAIKPRAINTSTGQGDLNILQMLAIELVCAACVDPSGNIRRGASAALQELVGRHPNTILDGIPLVQVVDYHAVARRSRAMIDVAQATAALGGSCYWAPIIESLMQWRGIGSPDAESRRHAAKALGTLSLQESFRSLLDVIKRLLSKFHTISHSDVETRHGCLLAIAATVDAFTSLDTTGLNTDHVYAHSIACQIAETWKIFDSPSGPSKDDLTLQASRPEFTAEASSCLIFSLSRSFFKIDHLGAPLPSATLLDKTSRILSLCLSRSDDISIQASSKALSELWPLLPSSKQDETIQAWFSHVHTTWNSPTGRGHIYVLGRIFKRIGAGDSSRESIIELLMRCAEKEDLIEKRVAAVKSLTTGVLPYIDITDSIAEYLILFLNDYTTDRRGDIGSLIRVEAIQAARVVLQRQDAPRVKDIVGCICRLAAEKLDKVRLEAWLCLQDFWEHAHGFPPLQYKYDHFSQVSSHDYFFQLLGLQAVAWLRAPLFQGLATSAVAGAEGLIRASRSALVQSINKHESQQRQDVVALIVEDLLGILGGYILNDRFAIPVMELLAFLLDGYVSCTPDLSDPRFAIAPFPGKGKGINSGTRFRKLFVLVQRAHFKSSNMTRLEAAIRIYGPLSRQKQLRTDVLKKMTGMLLHPFPRVRSTTADYLYVETGLDIVKNEDWSKQPRELKAKVEQLRDELGCK